MYWFSKVQGDHQVGGTRSRSGYATQAEWYEALRGEKINRQSNTRPFNQRRNPSEIRQCSTVSRDAKDRRRLAVAFLNETSTTFC